MPDRTQTPTPEMLRPRRSAYKFRAETSEDGRISGYASVFGVRNSYGEVFLPGAWEETLAEKSADKPLVMGYQHRDVIGKWDSHEEDGRGLHLGGAISDTSTGRDARVLVADGAITGLSVGFWPVVEAYVPGGEEFVHNGVTYKQDAGSFYILKADLMEASLVMAPSDDEARLERDMGEKIRRAFPALNGRDESWDEVAYSMALLMGGRGAGAFADLSDAEHLAIYERLATAYERHDREPPAYTRNPDFKNVEFRHDERRAFADVYLRKRLADIESGLTGFDGELSEETRAMAATVAERLRGASEPVSDSLSELKASLDAAAETVRARA